MYLIKLVVIIDNSTLMLINSISCCFMSLYTTLYVHVKYIYIKLVRGFVLLSFPVSQVLTHNIIILFIFIFMLFLIYELSVSCNIILLVSRVQYLIPFLKCPGQVNFLISLLFSYKPSKDLKTCQVNLRPSLHFSTI